MFPIRTLLLAAACCLLAGPAGASYTIDLIWSDTGTATLTVIPGDSPAPSGSSGACADGFLFSGGPGRCLEVRLTAAAPFQSASISLGWNTGFTGITLDWVGARSVGRFGDFDGTQLSASPLGDLDPCLSQWSFCDAAYGSFGGSPSGLLPAGVYTLGSVNFDTSAFVKNSLMLALLRPGVDGVVDENGFAAPVTINHAWVGCLSPICVIPEPGTGALLLVGLVGIGQLGRFRRH